MSRNRSRGRWTLCAACLYAPWLYACGTPEPKAITTDDGRAALVLPYCLDATQCFVLADQTCPQGYEVVRWQASRPDIIICR